MENSPTAVVLLSGGMDSSTTLAWAVDKGYRCSTISFDYGQRHQQELDAAKEIAQAVGVERHLVLRLDLTSIGGSALTADLPVPKDRLPSTGDAIPPTYVPARNTIFLSCALAWAEVLGCQHIFIGANAVDYSGYPDCRPEFIDAFERMANLATKAGVEGTKLSIHAPLIDLTKAQIVDLGLMLGIDYSLTRSCYDPAPDGTACGRCDACRLRLKGFSEAGMSDPVTYSASST